MSCNCCKNLQGFPLVFAISAALLLLSLLVMTAGPQSQSVSQSLQSGAGKVSQLVRPAGQFVTLAQPEDNSVLESPTVKVVGKTNAGSTVVVIAGDDMQLLEVGTDGNFSLNLNLSEGATTIEVTSFGQNGEEKTVVREVYYSEETL